MPSPQNYKNHARRVPIFHFFVIPVLLANFITTIVRTVRTWPHHPVHHIWLVVVAAAFLLTPPLARMFALKAQDRTIRLEERLRLKELVSSAEYVEIDGSLTMRQYIALRFASNAELPQLAQRAVREKLTGKQIKEAIVSWRPDTERV